MRLCRQAAVFALVLAFLLPLAAAAQPRLVDRGLGEHTALVSHLWDFLTNLWEAAGSSAEPLGTPQPTTDAGSRPDPLGNPQPTTDEGYRLDPLG